LNRLEPHSVVGTVSLVTFKDLFIHRGQQCLVSNSRLVELQILEVVSGVGLVQGIIPDDIFVSREFLRCVIPVRNELILKSIVVVVERISNVQRLRRSVIHGEVVLLAVRNKRVAIFILGVAVVSQDRFAQAKLVV